MISYDKTILERIKDVIGDAVTDIISYKDLIDSGFNYVADLIPPNSELWRLEELPSAEDNVVKEGKKIITITRSDSNNIFPQVCKEITFEIYSKGEDATSIYYTGGSYRSPVYSIHPDDGKIYVRPAGGNVKVYYFPYFDANVVESNWIDNKYNMENIGFPGAAVHAGVLKSASNILQAYISNATQDDEDNELLGLLTAQSGTLDKLFSEEIQRLLLPYKLIGDGEEK
tara:strand:+ start:2030 stop:2713 length:684 start_codon:yes stop_codon:yes gene_type:complete